MHTLSELLTANGLEKYLQLFLDNDVDVATLRILTDKDLAELGLPFGARKRLLNAVAGAAVVGETASAATDTPPGDERRQLTVMFSDVVGFTAISERLDPEILQDVTRAYEDACAACVSRYDGYVFQRLGDGIIAFFGFPLAHERGAERAILAARDIVAAMPRLVLPEEVTIAVRVGLAAGIVVVSSDGREAFGETMALAARLQTVAAPGHVVVSPRVRKLAAGAFDFEDLGEHVLKGISAPLRVHGVRGLRRSGDTAPAATALVGRVGEMDTLVERWRRVRDSGNGHAIDLCGEPGIGKSGLSAALCERLGADGVRVLRFQCSPFHANSAFHPITTHLEAVLRLDRVLAADDKLDRLEAMICGAYGLPRDDVRFIAALLAIPCEARYGATALSPRQAKVETIRVLQEMLRAAARSQPSLLVFEDVHWADPTTVDILSRLVDGLAGVSLLAVITHRPEFEAPWSARADLTLVELARLTPGQSAEMLAHIVGGKALPPEVARQIVERTDGVPLFVEELTRAVLESGGLVDAGDRYVYAGADLALAIPETLRDSLAARLDRLVRAKRIAQIGSVVGRSFSHRVLAAVAEMAPADLVEGLAELTDSGLALRSGEGADASYTFKHALVQEAAYDSLLKSQRRSLHARIAEELARASPDAADREPELLAHHFSAAGEEAAASPLWFRAGEVAMARFAVPEAVSHFRRGLQALATLPEDRERDLAELRFRAALGPALVAERGWAHPELTTVLEPAWRLTRELGHQAGYLPILNALWVHTMCTDRLDASMLWAARLLETAGDDGALEVVGHRAVAGSAYWLGHFDKARRHGDTLRQRYDAAAHWHVAQLTNTDPVTGEGIYRAQYLWMLGYPDQAVAETAATEAHARQRNHPFDLAFALTLGAQAFDFLRRPDDLMCRADEADALGRRFGLPLFCEVMVEISRGIALIRAGGHVEGAARLERAVGRLEATGHRIWIAYLRATIAEALERAGETARAEALLDESLARIEAGEERAHHAEVLRLRGWMRARRDDATGAEADLRAAIAVARGQGAKSWELRAATTLARLLSARGAPAEGLAALEPLLGWFDEGFETRDLRAATALVATLRGAGEGGRPETVVGGRTATERAARDRATKDVAIRN